MFNFKNYPKLYGYHKEQKRLDNAMYKAEAHYHRSNDEKDHELFIKALNEAQNYTLEIYSKVVYDIFSGFEPMLFNRRLKEYVQWQSVFKNNFSELSNGDKKSLVALIEEDGCLYRLMPDYYVQN